MAVTGLEGLALLVARVGFGGVIAFMGLNHFLQTDELSAYAGQKGIPAPRLSVLASGAAMVLGGLAILVGVFALVGAVAVAGFLLVAALTMHDFWAVPPDQQQDELTQFLKNVVMAGGAIAFGVLATQTWGLSLGLGLV